MRILSRQRSDFFSNTEVWLVESEAVGDVFRICISAPADPIEKAGVVFALDAELSAGSLVSALRSLAIGTGVPPLWGVSIGYPVDADPSSLVLRNRDLTPVANEEIDRFISAMLQQSDWVSGGGSDAFLSFILDELQPALFEAFPMDPDETTLAGASYGGLFTTYALLTRPDSFSRYMPVCPSIWRDKELILKKAQELDNVFSKKGTRVYFCAGEHESKEATRAALEQHDAATLNAMPRIILECDMIGDMQQVASLIEEVGGATVTCVVQPDELHQTVLISSFSRGLRWLFETDVSGGS